MSDSFTEPPVELTRMILGKLDLTDSLHFREISEETDRLVHEYGPFPNDINLFIRAEMIHMNEPPQFFGENCFIVITSPTSDGKHDTLVIEGNYLYHIREGKVYPLEYNQIPQLFGLMHSIDHFRFEMGTVPADFYDTRLRERLWKEFTNNTPNPDSPPDVTYTNCRVLMDFSKCIKQGLHLGHCTFVAESFAMIEYFLDVSDPFTMENLHIYAPDMPDDSDQLDHFYQRHQFKYLRSVELFRFPKAALECSFVKNLNSIALHTDSLDDFDTIAEMFVENFSRRNNFFGLVVCSSSETMDKKFRIRDRLDAIKEIQGVETIKELQRYAEIFDPKTYGQMREFSHFFWNLTEMSERWRKDPFKNSIPESDYAPKYAARQAKIQKWRVDKGKEAVGVYFDYFNGTLYAGSLIFMMGVFDG